MPEETSLRRSLEEELNNRLKVLVFDEIPTETIKDFLLQSARERIADYLRRYEIQQYISDAVERAIREEVPEVIEEMMAQQETQDLLKNAVRQGLEKGLAQVSARLRDRTANLASSM